MSRIFRFQQPLQNRVPRVQVLLPLPKRSSHRFRNCFFFVRQNLPEARACRASSPSAAGGRCSEARMAQRSKYGVTPPYFGHRKRGCEATSSPFVYHRQSFGDNYRFCFTAILLVFTILIKLRRTVFSVRRFFFIAPFLLTLCHTVHAIRLVHHQKSINHNSNPFVTPISISVFRLT